jgi:hypothetical protein
MRDGDVQKTTLNLVTARLLDTSQLGDGKTLQDDPQFRRILLEPIPTQDIGPYDHPWRADPEVARP